MTENIHDTEKSRVGVRTLQASPGLHWFIQVFMDLLRVLVFSPVGTGRGFHKVGRQCQ